ncbi:MAG: hypothetical protein AB8H80_09925 [Planctomycetota bacterium]
MSRPKRWTLAATGTLLLTAAPAQQLVRDFHPTSSLTPGSSFADPKATLPNGDVLFTQNTADLGYELWRTDGTYAGTHLVADIQPGYLSSTPYGFVRLPNGTFLFAAYTQQFGGELWRTDGTPQGTSLVRDVEPGQSGSYLRLLTLVGNECLFVANNGLVQRGLWRTDGTSAGTTFLANIHPPTNPLQPGFDAAALGNTQAVFPFRDAGNTWQLWRTDLSAGGTVKVIDLPAAATSLSEPTGFRPFGSRALFLANGELWLTDGTSAGTFALAPARTTAPSVDGSTAYFIHANGGLWRTDGTIAGSLQVAAQASAVGGSPPMFLGVASGGVYLAAGAGTTPSLLFSNGTAAGTSRVASLEFVFTPNGRAKAAALGNLLIFAANSPTSGAGLWRSDGTLTGTYRIAEVDATALQPFQGGLLFRGTAAGTGTEMWFTDGTAAGTHLLLDLNRTPEPIGTEIAALGNFRDQAVLHVEDDSGMNLWLSDGTTAGTRRITSFGNIPLAAARFASTSATFVVTIANSPTLSQQLWVYNPSIDAMQPINIESLHPTFRATLDVPAALGDAVVFTAHTAATGREPWITDGTLAGTRPIAELNPGTGAGTISGYATWRGRSYFVGSQPGSGPEPWMTDGTAAGTTQLLETAPGTSGTSSLQWHAAGELLFFASMSENEIWRTDGSAGGTFGIGLLSAGFVAPRQLQSIGDRLAAIASSAGIGRVLLLDGTGQGIQALPQPTSAVSLLALSDDRILIVSLSAGSNGHELWTSDGTAVGTQFLSAWTPPSSGQQAPSRISESRILRAQQDPQRGNELHVIDGSSAGVQVLLDLAPGSSNPSSWIRAGKTVLFRGDNGTTGSELYAFDMTLLQDSATSTYGFGCAGSGTRPPQISVDGDAYASSAAIHLAVEGAFPNATVLFGIADDDAATATAGCHVWLGGTAAIVVATAADAQGRAVTQLPVAPALFGTQFFAQGFAVDANGPLLGFLSATAGLEVVLGP